MDFSGPMFRVGICKPENLKMHLTSHGLFQGLCPQSEPENLNTRKRENQKNKTENLMMHMGKTLTLSNTMEDCPYILSIHYFKFQKLLARQCGAELCCFSLNFEYFVII